MNSLRMRCDRAAAFGLTLASCTILGCETTASDESPEQEKTPRDESDDLETHESSSQTTAKSPKDAGKTAARTPDAGAAGRAKDASTSAPATEAASQRSQLPCDVEAIVSERCGACHGDPIAAGAPMPLTTYAHFQAAASTDKMKKVYQLVQTRINASTKAMPPPSSTALTGNELETLNAWLDRDAPPADETCKPTASRDAGASDPGSEDVTGLDCYKLLAHAPGDKKAKFKVGAAVDAYWNFGFQAPWQGTVYGKLVRPVIDNKQVLHHWILYKEPVQDGSITATIGQHTAGEMIHGWAPGGVPMDFRKHGDVAFELPGGTYSIEVHYNSTDPNAEDASGVEVCTQKMPPKDIATLSWLGYDQGGTISYATGVCLNPASEWTGTCVPQSQEPIHLMYLVPHLHQTGRHVKSVINGPNGSRVLHDADFDFAYQVSYDTDEVLMPGETITTTCTFSAPNCAGQSTTQEMCYLYAYAYPKYALTDNGPEGTFMHGKGVCLGQ